MTFYGCRCWPSTVCAVGVSSRCLLVRRSGWVPGLHSEPSQNRPWKGQSHANFKARIQWKKQCRKAETIWYATLHGLVVRSQLQHFLVDFRWCFEIEETRHKCRRGSRKAEFASNSTKFKQKHPLVTQQLPWKITIIELSGPTSIAILNYLRVDLNGVFSNLKYPVSPYSHINPCTSIYIHINLGTHIQSIRA